MRFLRSPAGLASAIVLTAGMAVMGTLPASAQATSATQLAATGKAKCPANTFCAWTGPNFTGLQYDYGKGLPLRTWFSVGDGDGVNFPKANNSFTSFYNHRSDITYVDENDPYNGPRTCHEVLADSSSGDLAGHDWPAGGSMNKSISALRLTVVTKRDSAYCAG